MPSTESPRASAFPNFFIIGAPKCGTTSLAGWLSSHPGVFMCQPKEPNFFSSDIRAPGRVRFADEYLDLFERAGNRHVAVGEASTTYLRSEVAVPRILEKVPNARFIVCLRNPVDMFCSVHAQLLRGGRESEVDLAKAWALQDRRRKQRASDRLSDLHYADICLLGDQVERLLSYVPSTRVLFVFLEDIAHTPRQAYLQVLAFLGIPDDGRQAFEAENTRVQPRSRLFSRALLGATVLKERLGVRKRIGLGSALARLSVQDVKPVDQAIDPSLRREMGAYFQGDIELLGRLVGRDLRSWQEDTST